MCERILICRGGALGDLVVTFPALERIRTAFPKAHIVLMGYMPQARLATAGGLVDEAMSLDRADMASWFSPDGVLSAEQASFLGSFALAVSFLHDPDGRLAERLREAGVGRVVVRSPLVSRGHAADHFLGILGDLGLSPAEGTGARLVLPEALGRRGAELVREVGDDVVALHPGSGSPRKNWPLDGFAGLAGKIAEELALNPVFLLGEAEAGMEETLARQCPCVPRLKGLELLDLAALLSRCRAYVGNDSGVTHLAAAVGTPVVAVFGPTDPAVWAPRGAHVQVVRAEAASPAGLAAMLRGVIPRIRPDRAPGGAWRN